MKEGNKFLLYVLVFATVYFIPFSNLAVETATLEAFKMLSEYAREHVLFA